MTDLMREIVETMGHPVCVLADDLHVLMANRAFFHAFAVEEKETIGHAFRDLGNRQWDIPALHELFQRLIGDVDRIENFRVEHTFDTIGRRVMIINGRRLRSSDDGPRLLLAITDDTERERMHNELIARAEFSEKLTDSIREAILVLTPDLRVERANQSFYDTFGVARQETEGRQIYEIGNGQWNIPELRQALEDVLPARQTFDDFEVNHTFPAIGHRTMLLNARELDHLPLILLAIRDVTENRRHEADQKVLIGELQHRVKNILANVQSIASATLSRSRTLEEFEEAFLERLDALARTQDLLMRKASGSVKLRDVISSELQAHGWEEDGRLTITGPTVSLNRRETQSIAMLIHELATNAVKYGAFAGSQGRLDISWSMQSRPGRDELSLEWRESGLTGVEPPDQAGFGTDLIRQGIAHMLGGETRLEFEPQGVLCTVRFVYGAPDAGAPA